MGTGAKRISSFMASAVLAFGLSQAALAQENESAEPEAQNEPVQSYAESESSDAPALNSSFSLAVNPMVPVPLIAGMALLYGGFCVMRARRRMQGAWLRATAGAALTATLINPELVAEDIQDLPTEILIVVDKSASQQLGNRAQMTQDMYDRLVRDLSGLDNINIRTIEADGTLDGRVLNGTSLFADIDAQMGDIPRDRLGGMILLSDGQIQDVPLPQEGADNDDSAAADIPYYALISGSEDEKDRRLILNDSPRFGAPGAEAEISFSIIDEGIAPDDDGAEVTLTVNGELVANKTVSYEEFDAARISFTVPDIGINAISVNVEAVEGELDLANNNLATSVEGVRDHLNVLLVSGAPYQGTRVTRDFFSADPDSSLVQFTILQPPEKQDVTPMKDMALIPLPAKALFQDKINDYDLIVFDRYQVRGVLPAQYFDDIAQYVKQGGALLVASGPEYAQGRSSLYNTPLRPVLPLAPTGNVAEKAYHPQVTAEGTRHPVTRFMQGWAAQSDQSADMLPEWGAWYRLVEGRANDAATPAGQGAQYTVMKGADNAPLLVLRREEQGRVAMLQSDSAWLWARGHNGGGPYNTLMSQTVDWLTGHPALEEEALSIRPDPDDSSRLIIERQTMMGDNDSLSYMPEPVTLKTPSGSTIDVSLQKHSPGLWRASIEKAENGVYQIQQKSRDDTVPDLMATMNVTARNPAELSEIISTTAKLSPFVESTGGHVLRMSSYGPDMEFSKQENVARDDHQNDASSTSLAILDRDQTVTAGRTYTSIIPPWAGMMVMIALMAAAFYREGGKNLLRRGGPSGSAPQPPKTEHSKAGSQTGPQ